MPDDPNEITIDDARIRELMLMNLFAVFNERDSARRVKAIAAHLAFHHGAPEQPPAVSGYDVALVRDGRIASLYTLVNSPG